MHHVLISCVDLYVYSLTITALLGGGGRVGGYLSGPQLACHKDRDN
jgi:hypothetical protein